MSQEATAAVSAEGLRSEDAAHLAFGAALRAYRFDRYRTKEKAEDKPKLAGLTILVDDAPKAKAAYAPLQAVAEGVFLSRDLVSEPPNVLNPTEMAERCKALTKLGVKVEILGPKELDKLGFGALMGVAQGSARNRASSSCSGTAAARVSRASRSPSSARGVTFDTGGISIKRPAGWRI